MVLRFFLFASLFLFVSCHTIERDNPDDPNGVNYRGQVPSFSSPSVPSSNSTPSSSSLISSSSPVTPSSSSLRVSSSSSKPSSSSNSPQANVVYGDSVTYHGETYQTVKIGTQTWFQRNLNYAADSSKCGNGSSLSNVNTANCGTYGRLYDWASAMALPYKCNSVLSTSDADCAITTSNHRGICPSGWHIPSDADWDTLMTAVGGQSTAGRYLKATSGWNSNGNGEDKFGFAALPGGDGDSDGSFDAVGNYGYWWSANEFNSYYACGRYMYYGYKYVSYHYGNKSGLFSIRCLKD